MNPVDQSLSNQFKPFYLHKNEKKSVNMGQVSIFEIRINIIIVKKPVEKK